MVTFPGVYRAVVRNNNDPQGQRRLKLELQTSPGQLTDWCWPLEPSSIHTAVPVVGQGVWVFFVNGDPEYPVWFGAFGTNQGPNKQVFIKPLANSVSLTDISDLVSVTAQPDGTQELDLVETVIALATELRRLENTLATRTSPSHRHDITG